MLVHDVNVFSVFTTEDSENERVELSWRNCEKFKFKQ